MNNLHAYFALKNEQAFYKALEANRTQAQPPTPSSSAGKRLMAMTASSNAGVNSRDWLGRTVLHLACSVTEPYALSYVRLLLAHPGIDPNIQDVESRWTPLHRALYVGNISACQLLLRRPDIDTQLRDNEGLTAFDLYSLTVEGTRPIKPGFVLLGEDPLKKENMAADLLTWGNNRHATLGHVDSKDRLYPDYVPIHRLGQDGVDGSRNKFTGVKVKAIRMAKLHTTVITNEKDSNLRVCGLGGGGRLGPTHHTQYTLLPTPQIPPKIIAVAPAQDHTLVLTSRNEVWSWGLGRFSQLGYVAESVSSSSTPGALAGMNEEPIQHVPRKVGGLLKKEEVIGIAACKMASACWTKVDVFTWGTNSGQLGYDSASQSVQILPRKVTGVQDVVGIALTVRIVDTAMACLLTSHDVVCFRDNARFRIKFSAPEISSLQPYAPPLPSKTPIAKITACEGLFGALSMYGDVWTFAVSGASGTGTGVGASSGMGLGEGDKEKGKEKEKEKERVVVKPQRVWAAKRPIDPASDIALGSDGDLILCTVAGHVFVRSRTAPGTSHVSVNSNVNAILSTIAGTATSISPPSTMVKTAATATSSAKGKFYRVPGIHRAVAVCANPSGGFGALRLNYVAKKVDVEMERHSTGKGEEGTLSGSLAEDLGRLACWRDVCVGMEDEDEGRGSVIGRQENEDGDANGNEDDDQGLTESSRSQASFSARRLLKLIDLDKKSRRTTGRGIFDFEAETGAGLEVDTGTTIGKLPNGADMLIQSDVGMLIPVHQLVLAARSAALKGLFDSGGGTLTNDDGGTVVTATYHHCTATTMLTTTTGSKGKGKVKSHSYHCPYPYLTITNMPPLAILLLLEYMYSDVVPVLDIPFMEAARVRRELGVLVKLVGIEGDIVGGRGRGGDTTDLKGALGRDMWSMFKVSSGCDKLGFVVGHTADPSLRPGLDLNINAGIIGTLTPVAVPSSIRPDVMLRLSDVIVPCHSLMLRARCPLFKHFFEEEAWTVNRWALDGTISVDLRHMRWRDVRYAIEWIYSGEGEGEDEGLFKDVDYVDSIHELINLIIDVMAVASELLLDRLLLLCSNALLQHVTLKNVYPILIHATYLNAFPLVESLQDYIMCNLEGIMELRLLDRDHDYASESELNAHLIPALGAFIRARQADYAPFTRKQSKIIMDEAVEKHKKWLEERDFPKPIVRSPRQRPLRDKGAISPELLPRRVSGPMRGSPVVEPIESVSKAAVTADDLFFMEDVSIPPLSIGKGVSETPESKMYTVPKMIWGVKKGQTGDQNKVDMKTIMAETETETLARTRSGGSEVFDAGPNTSTPSPVRWLQKPSQRERRQMSQAPVAPTPASTPTPPRPRGASPWNLPLQQVSTASSSISASAQCPPEPIQTPVRTGHSPQTQTQMRMQGGSTPPARGSLTATPSSVLQQAANPSSALRLGFSPALGARRIHSDSPAWTVAPVQSTLQPGFTPASTPPSITALSFSAIQEQQQRDQLNLREKRSPSLRDIQEEERAKQEEEAFLMWWSAEEKRVRLEQQQAMRMSDTGGLAGGKRERGRGGARRGGGGGRSSKEGRGKGDSEKAAAG